MFAAGAVAHGVNKRVVINQTYAHGGKKIDYFFAVYEPCYHRQQHQHRQNQQDASQCKPEWLGQMDAVIADVPCSGYGIIRKKPDIRYKEPATMQDLPQLQLAILKNQARYVKPGGVLIYSTCTLVRAENEGVVESFLQEDMK